MRRKQMSKTLWIAAALMVAGNGFAADYSWQQPHAKVLATGDLEWAPRPFVYEHGDSVRYIDFEHGDDASPGDSKDRAWKHHPWDANATGKAKACQGIHTYVFKRGVVYRGTLIARESGEEGNPIRLTADPSWGDGEARLFGSERITSQWKRCAAADAPRIGSPEKVWYTDLPFAIVGARYAGGQDPSKAYTQMVVELTGDKLARVDLARSPNWTITNPNYPLSDWWDVAMPTAGAIKLPVSFPPTDPADWIGGSIWATWGSGSGAGANMATFQQGTITAYDAGAIRVDIDTSPRNKFFIENLPQLLDAPNEFYYSPGGAFPRRLYVRLSGERDPNTATIEVGTRPEIVRIVDQSHIVISGLTLGINNQPCPGVASPGPPHWNPSDGSNQAIELSGKCSNIEVSNCKFRYTVMAIAPRRNDAVPPNVYHNVRITDNDIAFNDDQAITLGGRGRDGSGRNIQVLRNKLYHVGSRQTCRGYSSIPAINVTNATSVEIAGNVLDYCWGSGINGNWRPGTPDQPGSQVRVLVHHNKVTRSMLGCNDYGGIEGWQSGPAFFFCNVSGNPGGYRPFTGDNQYNPWGFAIYFDHAHRHIAFNNIVWGIHNSLGKALERNAAGFMQAAAADNFYANNTIHNFYFGFRFCHKGGTYIGNLLDNITYCYHDESRADATVAYSGNVYHGNPQSFAGTQRSLDAFKQLLASKKARSSEVGLMADGPVMIDPANHDFRPTGDAVGSGVRIFLPWNLARVAGEWHFRARPADFTRIASDDRPGGGDGNVLVCPVATEASYVMGALEDWTRGALRFDGAELYCSAASSPAFDMDTGSFIIEAYVKTSAGGVIVSKAADKGYTLDIPPSGKVRLRLKSGREYSVSSVAGVMDGQWHHILAEVDRAQGKVRLYVDGAPSQGETSGAMPDAKASLANEADFLVGKDASGVFFKGDMDFLRVAGSCFAESDTTFEELYAWEFDGPATRDFAGTRIVGPRDAGALQHAGGVR
jgi:concanavalin A-like lectin/glucanase superfamily protein